LGALGEGLLVIVEVVLVDGEVAGEGFEVGAA
jgi:hypothetical protein